MNVMRRVLRIDPMELAVPLIIFAVTMAVGYLVRRLFLRALAAWSSRTRSRPGLILTDSLRGPALIWVLILAAHLALESSRLPARPLQYVNSALAVLWILSLTLMSMRIAGDLVRFYGGQIPGALPVTTLTQNLAQTGCTDPGDVWILLNHLGARSRRS